ncbi:hypothetical protein DFAR_2910023 [Desulfarculales bacterium]
MGQQVPLTPEMRVTVLGDGKLGLLIALGLRGRNSVLLLVGRHVHKLAIAQAQGVATLALDPGSIWLPPGGGAGGLRSGGGGHWPSPGAPLCP